MWLEGRVEEVVGDAGGVVEDGRGALAPGSVRIATARSVVYVPPGKVSEVLRLVSDEAALISVIGPGAGLKANKVVYDEIEHDARFRIHIFGQRGEQYDRYPEHWDGGSTAPNLESFAGDVLAQGVVENSDCIIAGSRGGQVVLPCLWRVLGANAPPAVVFNGGCAMALPGPAVQWPLAAVTILVLGGDDYFRGRMGVKDYLATTRKFVPRGNNSTAILYVREMEHMPQTGLLQLLLRPLLLAAIYWRASGRAPSFELRTVLKELEANQWNGQLSYLDASSAWQEVSFGVAAKDQPDSPKNGKASKLRRLPTQAAHLAEQEERRAEELERELGRKEEEVRQLRAQLADAREKARQWQEVAAREEGDPGGGSPEAAAQGAGAPGLYMGQRAQYYSVSQRAWMDCEISAIRAADGAVQVNVKPDWWLSREEQAAKIRTAQAVRQPCQAARGRGQSPVKPMSTTPQQRATAQVRALSPGQMQSSSGVVRAVTGASLPSPTASGYSVASTAMSSPTANGFSPTQRTSNGGCRSPGGGSLRVPVPPSLAQGNQGTLKVTLPSNGAGRPAHEATTSPSSRAQLTAAMAANLNGSSRGASALQVR